ncbi:MAG: DUF1192 domain-containing protein [Hyphomicrobiales bacterium]|nr:DUF1192 domain-containing protein [Hyphomicrobiales bacterium]
MDPEELEPRGKKNFEIGEDLTTISVDELKEIIAVLEQEIARIEKEINVKESSKKAADSVFKS